MVIKTDRISFIFLAALAFLGSQTASAFPTGGGGCFFCSPFNLGGSIITFNLTSSDENGLAPVTFNFLENPDDGTPDITGRLCLSGKIHATIIRDAQTGEAVYELLGADGSNRGICYENVTQVCDPIDTDSLGGNCSAEKCTYTVPALENIPDPGALLDGRFKVDTSLPTSGPYTSCSTSTPDNVCNFEVGFGFNNGIPANLFPAATTLNDESVDANVVLYSNEVCIECGPADLKLKPGTAALKSKSDKLRACEALTLKSDWCNDLQSTGFPNCFGDNDPTNPPIGGMNTAVGDFQIQDTTLAFCINDLADLKSLPSCEFEIAIAACGGGPGLITYPESFLQTTCSFDGDPAEIFFFSPAEGGGSAILNLAAVGANPDAPGYAGDNTIPPVLPRWTAIVSTPDNQVNDWDFSGTYLHMVAFIHGRNNDDKIDGSNGNDTILGGSGADTLNGNEGDDVLQGGNNADLLNGDAGNDLLLGYDCTGPNADCSSFSNNGSDDDVLNGGADNDCLDGGRGNDVLTGGTGSDAFILFGNVDNDTITDYTDGEDVIVDLNANATVNWVQGKRGAASICEVAIGGSDATLIDGMSKATCEGIVLVVPSAGDTLPTQCAGHPYTFQ